MTAWASAAALVMLAAAVVVHAAWRRSFEARRWGVCSGDVAEMCRMESPSGNYTMNRLRCLLRYEADLHPACRKLLVDHGVTE